MSQLIDALYEDGVLKPLEPLNLAEHQRVRVSVAADGEIAPPPDAKGESFFEAASRLGYIGCIKGTPPDLSTNKKYMEGFGKSGE
jgi:predicted DNA-binding antitoxin AbrB/MazE fold protein